MRKVETFKALGSIYLKLFSGRALKAGLIGLALVMFSQPAAAEDDDGLKGYLGAAVLVKPEFEGSDLYELQAWPVVDFRYGRFFLSMDRGLGVNLLEAPGWTAAPALRYRPGRRESASDLLRGLGDVSDGLEAGAVLGWRPGPAGLSLKVFQGLGAAEGLTLELGADYAAALTDRLNGRLALAAMFADRKYNQARFGVTAERSALSGYRVYDPGAGLKHTALAGSLVYSLTDELALGLLAEYKRLTGPAADSPLVERGSANQGLSGLSLTYNFK